MVRIYYDQLDLYLSVFLFLSTTNFYYLKGNVSMNDTN